MDKVVNRRFLTIAALALLACAMAGRQAPAGTLTDPTQPATGNPGAPRGSGLRLEGILCHSGLTVAIVNGRLVHAGDRIGGNLIGDITPQGVRYSRGGRGRMAYAPEPQLDGCGGTAGVVGKSGEPVLGVDVAGAPASAFFEGLVEGTPYNILVAPNVGGRITMSLKNVTLQQVLEAGQELYGFDYRRTAAGYLILPAAVQTRIFHISYLDVQRYGVSNTRISSGQVTQGDYNSQYGGNTVTSASANTPQTATVGHGKDKTTIDTTGTSVMTRDDTDFWGDLEATLHAMVGNGPGRRVIVDRQSGIVVVRALPEQLREVSDYLKKTEDTVTRQVLLEAKIVEVDLDSGYQAGIDWAKVLQLGASTYFIGQSSPAGGFGTNLLTPTNTPITVGPGNPITSLATNTLGGAFTLGANFTDFNAFIQLLSTEGKTHVLSSPRVSTLDNQKAIIKAGVDQFYVTGLQSNTSTSSGGNVTSNNVILTPFFSGVALDVTPQIGAHGDVLLHIHPIVSVVTNQTVTLEVEGSATVLPLAQSSVRESDSIVRARSGQVIAIGGLMQETVDRQQYKTPLLGDVPGLGRLFRSEQDQKSKIELVILLRAMVVGRGDWSKLVRERPVQGGKP
jgi:MSHA biogenesis protein MshL